MNELLKPDGSVSSMRVCMIMCVVTGCITALLGVWTKQDPVGIGVLVAMLIAPVVGGKVAQKGKE